MESLAVSQNLWLKLIKFCFKKDVSLAQRRILPSLQTVYNTLTVTRNSYYKTLTISYRPNNCTVNIPPSTIRQIVQNV